MNQTVAVWDVFHKIFLISNIMIHNFTAKDGGVRYQTI